MISPDQNLIFSTRILGVKNSDFYKTYHNYPSLGSFVSLVWRNNHVQVVNEASKSLGCLPQQYRYLQKYLKQNIEFIGMVSSLEMHEVTIDVLPL